MNHIVFGIKEYSRERNFKLANLKFNILNFFFGDEFFI